MNRVEHIRIGEKLAERNFSFFCKKLPQFVILNEDEKVIGIFDLSCCKNNVVIDSPEGYDQWIIDNLFKEDDLGYNYKKLDIALIRLRYPYHLIAPAKERYSHYLKLHKKRLIPKLIEENDFYMLTTYADIFFTRYNIDEIIDLANFSNHTEMVAFLLDFKNKNFRIDPFQTRKMEIRVNAPKVLSPGSNAYTKKYFSFTGFKEGRLIVQGYKGSDTTVTLPTDLYGIPVIGFNPRKSFGAAFGVAEEIIIPEGYLEVNSKVDNDYILWAYKYQGNLKKLSIADSVTQLQDFVFAKIHTLEVVKVGRGITSINFRLFVGCANLACLILPETIIHLDMIPRIFYYEKIGNYSIHAPKGSYAIEYAKENMIKYVEI